MNGVCEDELRIEPTAVRGGGGSVATACVVLYLAVVLGLFLAIRQRDDGVFTYTLDDPYIHLALAQSLAHGHYGINMGEPSSPSSSIVWPFLLTPFAAHRGAWVAYIPLAWNVLFCGFAAWLIGRTVDRWSWRRRSAPAGQSASGSSLNWRAPGRWEWSGRFLIAAALMVMANLVGLTFIGMEHGLQVLLAVACAAGVAEVFGGRPIPGWCLWAAVLGPLVRYETFALVAAVAIALCGQRRYRAAALAIGLSGIGPALFSWFLVSRGLPALPSSVLVKSMVYSFHPSFMMAGIATMLRSMYWGVHEVAWWNQLIVALLLLVLAVRVKERARRFVLCGALLAALLQLTMGRFNWFDRYEIYAISFTTIVAWTGLASSSSLRPFALLPGLLVLCPMYMVGMHDLPAAAGGIYQQQYQMHRFLAGYRGHAVAVNDLGLVSYDRPLGLYVLDLWGLASPEASRRTVKDAAWLDAITRAHGAELAIIYPQWYADGAPDDWAPLGTMCLTGRQITVSRRCVVFYSTPLGDHDALLTEFAAFATTVPRSVKVVVGRDSTEVDDP